MLHESACTATSGLAMGCDTNFLGTPVTSTPKRLKKKQPSSGTFPIADDYMGISSSKHPKFGKSLVWQPQEQQHGSDWYNKDSVFAQLPDPDERLLKNHRGHGY
jgi:hypothetical protein